MRWGTTKGASCSRNHCSMTFFSLLFVEQALLHEGCCLMLSEHMMKAAARSVSERVPNGRTIAMIVQPKVGAFLQEQAADGIVADFG